MQNSIEIKDNKQSQNLDLENGYYSRHYNENNIKNIQNNKSSKVKKPMSQLKSYRSNYYSNYIYS